ncbi:MAG: hypothetical protein E6G67_10265 [Actinobacteria bacterium]|nr:MAG: hypothetical protein E6G67_10265 [Actinomycetota bacterium]
MAEDLTGGARASDAAEVPADANGAPPDPSDAPSEATEQHLRQLPAPTAEEPRSLATVLQAGGRSHRGRFVLAYGLLALVLAGAAAALVAVLTGPKPLTLPPWSAWQPSGNDLDRANEIASFVERRYRLENGSQLVAIRAGPPQVQNVPITAIALSSPSTSGASKTNVSFLPASNSIVYILCGLGDRCAVRSGKPSAERLRLLRRETLELALYTFEYAQDIDSVVAFLPPKKGSRPTFTMFFQRSDLQAQLSRPLANTVTPGTPPLPKTIAAGEAATIDSLTNAHLFKFQFQPLADGGVVLILDPPTA